MCHAFAGQDKAGHAPGTRRLPLRRSGQGTSNRPENAFRAILDEIAAREAAREDVSTPCFMSQLRSGPLGLRGKPDSFISLLRCACLKVLEITPDRRAMAIAAE